MGRRWCRLTRRSFVLSVITAIAGYVAMLVHPENAEAFGSITIAIMAAIPAAGRYENRGHHRRETRDGHNRAGGV